VTLELLGGVADCSCCKKKDKGAGLAAHTSGGNCLGAFDVTNLLILSICKANPAPTE